jgi:hypothetical protein
VDADLPAPAPLDAEAAATRPAARLTPRAEAESARAEAPEAAAAAVNVDAEGDNAAIRLPGMHIETKGDQASVRIGGLTSTPTTTTGSVDVQGLVGDDGDNVSIRARERRAEVRTVRLRRGHPRQLDPDRQPAFRRRLALVGYEARGPVGGPLVVATVRSRDRNRGRVFEDAKDLVALNVGE